MNIKTKETKLIFAPQLAKQLLRLGYLIIDLKQDKFDPSKTVFIFKYESTIDNAIREFTKAVA